MQINLLEECNQTQQAIVAAQEALRLFPKNLWFRLKEALLLPALYSTEEEIRTYRQRFTEGLARLVAEIVLDSPDSRTEALSAIAGHVNIGLGFQVQNDRDLQSRYGELVCRIMAANYPEFTQPLPMPSRGGNLRIGYVSGRFRDVSATKCFLGWITGHSRSEFDVFAYHLGGRADAGTAEVKRCATHFRHLTGSFEATCRTILADQLHLLVFLDVGLKPLLTQIAATRLAPIQCLAWDQPVTSGLPTMDCFISSDAMEPSGAEQHYSEQLIRLPGLGVCFQKPVIPRMLLGKERPDFRLRKNAVVYLCCQSFRKYLPQHDDVFPQIARQVANAQFVFLTPNSFLERDLQARLDRAFALAGLKAGDYCVLLNEMDRFSYWNLHLVSDVFLDTIGWSGGVSTIEAIACGLPVVTLPGALMRSNHTRAILTGAGATETIARDKADYIAIASRLGLDPVWRREAARRIAQGSAALYSDKRCIAALEDFFRSAVSARPRRPARSATTGVAGPSLSPSVHR
jgi:predicted O-linked N-acetylglucosamine transferase (SPINDLY family)